MFGCQTGALVTATCERTSEASGITTNGAAFKHDRCTGGPVLRILPAAEELLGPVLNFVPGAFHVLAEAVGRVAADADNGQEGGGKEQKNETLNQYKLMSFHDVILEPGTRAGAIGCSPHRNCGIDPHAILLLRAAGFDALFVIWHPIAGSTSNVRS
jgi:hypothetical protein